MVRLRLPLRAWRRLVGAALAATGGVGPGAGAAHAQPSRLTRADGLASDYVQSIFVDRHGALWAATDAGASRYDGRGFTHFTVDDGLPHPYVSEFAQDDAGALWALGQNGLARFDGRRWRPDAHPCAYLVRSPPGAPVVCAGNPYTVRLHGRWRALPPGQIERAPAGPAFWRSDVGLWRLDGAAPRRVARPGACAVPVAGEGCRRIWSTTPDARTAVQYDSAAAAVVALRAVRAATPSGWAWRPERRIAVRGALGTVGRDRQAAPALATDGRRAALYVRNAPTLTVVDLVAGTQRTQDMGAGVQGVLFDETGVLWVAVFGRGIVRLDPDAPERLADGVFVRLAPAAGGGLWATGPGLWRVADDGDRAERVADFDRDVRAVVERGGVVAVSVEAIVWARDVGAAFRPVYTDPAWISGLDLAGDTLVVSSYGSGVRALVGWRALAKGRARAPVSGEVRAGLPGPAQAVPVAGSPAPVVEDVVRLASGRWAMTRSDGAVRVGRSALVRSAEAGLPSSAVYAMHESPGGTRWYGTDRGVGRERPGGPVETLGAAALAGQRIVGFVDAGGGDMWAVGERDVFRVSGHAAAVRRVGATLPGVSASVNAVRRVGEGLVVATADGLFRRPLPVERPAVVPGLDLRRVRVDDREARIAGDARSGWRLARLAPGEHRLDVFASPVSITSPAEVEYRIDEGAWAAAADGHVVLPGVGSGRYRVDLRAVAGSGAVSRVQSLAVEVAPHLWQRPWVWAVAALALALGLWRGAVAATGRRLRQRLDALEAEQRIARERERISRDLHDHVGGQLTTLASMADLARMQARGGDIEASSVSLDALGTEARQSLRQLRQTVYTLRHPDLTVEALYQQLVAQAEAQTQAAAPLALDARLDAPDPLRVVPSPLVLPLLRMAQEAVTNVVRHAGATRVCLRLAFEEEGLRLVVADDGVGMRAAGELTDGSGLDILTARARDLAGSVRLVKGLDGRGMSVEVRVPLGVPEGHR